MVIRYMVYGNKIARMISQQLQYIGYIYRLSQQYMGQMSIYVHVSTDCQNV